MAAEQRARAVWEGTLLEGQGRLSTERHPGPLRPAGQVGLADGGSGGEPARAAFEEVRAGEEGCPISNAIRILPFTSPSTLREPAATTVPSILVPRPTTETSERSSVRSMRTSSLTRVPPSFVAPGRPLPPPALDSAGRGSGSSGRLEETLFSSGPRGPKGRRQRLIDFFSECAFELRSMRQHLTSPARARRDGAAAVPRHEQRPLSPGHRGIIGRATDWKPLGRSKIVG
jgi:hypothetical protein